jgi:hypothetical protein
MTLRQNIRRVLKENKIKDQLEKLVDKVGLPQACRSVGGLDYLSKVLKVDKVELIHKYYVGKELSTQDMEDIGIGVGGYDFEFTIEEIIERDDEGLIFEIRITKGNVTIDDETYGLTDGKIRRTDFWWEIEIEMLDLFVNYAYSILENLKYEEDIEEIPYPQIEFYFLPSI